MYKKYVLIDWLLTSGQPLLRHRGRKRHGDMR